MISNLTSELHGTDNNEDRLAWSQTEVRKRSPACINVRKMQNRKAMKGYIFMWEIHASTQTQWWSFPGTLCWHILQYRVWTFPVRWSILSLVSLTTTLFDLPLPFHRDFPSVAVSIVDRFEALSLTVITAYKAPAINKIRHRFSQGDLKIKNDEHSWILRYWWRPYNKSHNYYYNVLNFRFITAYIIFGRLINPTIWYW